MWSPSPAWCDAECPCRGGECSRADWNFSPHRRIVPDVRDAGPGTRSRLRTGIGEELSTQLTPLGTRVGKPSPVADRSSAAAPIRPPVARRPPSTNPHGSNSGCRVPGRKGEPLDQPYELDRQASAPARDHRRPAGRRCLLRDGRRRDGGASGLQARRPAELGDARRHDLGGLQAGPGHELGGSLGRPDEREVAHGARPHGLRRPALQHDASGREHRLREPAAVRGEHPREPGRAVPRRLPQHAEPPESLQHDEQLLDGGFARPLRGRGRAVRPVPPDGNQWEYWLRDAGNAGSACPTGFTCSRNARTEGRAAWVADVGEAVAATFDNVAYVQAGQDRAPLAGVRRDDVPDDERRDRALRQPDPTKPNWSPTRYIPWTSFAAAKGVWPARAATRSPRRELGHGTYAHD